MSSNQPKNPTKFSKGFLHQPLKSGQIKSFYLTSIFRNQLTSTQLFGVFSTFPVQTLQTVSKGISVRKSKSLQLSRMLIWTIDWTFFGKGVLGLIFWTICFYPLNLTKLQDQRIFDLVRGKIGIICRSVCVSRHMLSQSTLRSLINRYCCQEKKSFAPAFIRVNNSPYKKTYP